MTEEKKGVRLDDKEGAPKFLERSLFGRSLLFGRSVFWTILGENTFGAGDDSIASFFLGLKHSFVG
jgi:hypothetical protein